MMQTIKLKFFILLFNLLFFSFNIKAQEFIIIQSTTSTRDSGFYDYLLPKFQEKFDIEVRVIAVGTGQAIKNAKNCDADLLLVHHKPSEVDFLKQGFGLYRKEIMYNDYVIIGPKNDPINLKNEKSIKEALKKILLNNFNFITRGDDSGTNKKEKELWRMTGIQPNPKEDRWYIDIGQGMGAALNIAVNKNAYTVSDRASWLNFLNKQNHEIILENNPKLYNFYGLIPLNPLKCPKVKKNKSKKFIDWISSIEGKQLINNFKIKGKQLFFSVD